MNTWIKLLLLISMHTLCAIEDDINMYREKGYLVPLTVEHITIMPENATVQLSDIEHPLPSRIKKRLTDNRATMRRTLFLRNLRKNIRTQLTEEETEEIEKKISSFNRNKFDNYHKELLTKLRTRDKSEQITIFKNIQTSYLHSYQDYLNEIGVGPISKDQMLKEFNGFFVRYDIYTSSS